MASVELNQTTELLGLWLGLNAAGREVVLMLMRALAERHREADGMEVDGRAVVERRRRHAAAEKRSKVKRRAGYEAERLGKG